MADTTDLRSVKLSVRVRGAVPLAFAMKSHKPIVTGESCVAGRGAYGDTVSDKKIEAHIQLEKDRKSFY